MIRIAVAAWLALLPLVAAAQLSKQELRATDADEYEQGSTAWVEQTVAPPAYPKVESLAEFRGAGTSSNRFFVDVDTLSIGKDGVVRYVLVVRSPGGAENVSFEGIRCETREQKAYAFGQRGGTWSLARDPQWRFIEPREVNRHHVVLFTEAFCVNGKTPPRAVREVVQRLRYGRL